MYTLKIPNALQTNKEGFEFLATILTNIQMNSQGKSDVLVDFSECTTIDGNLAAVIGALLDKARPLSNRILVTPPDNRIVKKVLARNQFLRFWQDDGIYEEKENYVEYHRFQSDASSDEFKTYILEGLIHKQKFPQHTELAGEKIVESIYEIYANAVTHGKTEYVYSCGEYMSERGVLEMTIVDCGQTIPGNVNDFLTRKGLLAIGDCNAIEWAFVSGNTTKSQTGGLGLAIIRDFIELNEGSIQVVSGHGFIEYRGNTVEQNLLATQFPGTVVNMKFNFNDNKNYFMKSERKPLDSNDLL